VTGPGTAWSAGSPTALVVMGVSGSGKTTVARSVAARLGWPFAEGDDFHPAANVAKMHAGIPLDDDDRWPWLRALVAWIGERVEAGESVVVTCSALKRRYRDLLASGDPCVFFVHVDVAPDVLRARLAQRTGHYMPASLLDSQLAALEPLQPDEPGVVVPGDGDPASVVDAVVADLRSRGRVPGETEVTRDGRAPDVTDG
jgi:gluconokinase